MALSQGLGVGISVAGIGLGVALWAVSEADVDIPFWALIAGGGFAGLLVLFGVSLVITSVLSNRPKETAMSEERPPSQQASDAGRDIYQAGRDINVNPDPPTAIPWVKRAGGPQFRLHPGINNGELICSFQIEATPQPGGVEARWVGAGTDDDWATPMPENVPAGAAYKKYQMKSVAMGPNPPSDEVAFMVRFYLEDGLHGGQWRWPLVQHQKGHWNLETHKGSHVFQPRLEDIS